MKTYRIAAALLLFSGACLAQAPSSAPRYQAQAAYPEKESAAVWRSLGASYVRKAVKDNLLDRDPQWNTRLDAVMAEVGTAASKLYPKYLGTSWRVLLIDDFGHGAVAFPGGTVLVDANFVRRLALTDNELALLLSHEVAHIVAGHPSEKLSFMAETLGKDRAPTAGSALLAFYTQDSYALLFEPTARLQEREADAIGAKILRASGFDALQALGLFDKLAKLEHGGPDTSSHDPATVRKEAILRMLAGPEPPARGFH
jgi:predicted Zn-dependent protease